MSLSPEVRRGGGLPFGMTCSQWACDPRYSTNARTLYSILVTYADTQERHTEKGKPYRAELAAQLGCSLSTLDRTLFEMQVAGMVIVEERTDPDNPDLNDANVYHLQDYLVMWKGPKQWVDPLPPGVKAADVAKKLIEERRRKKREEGKVRKGGVPKGVNPKAVKAAREAAQKAAEADTPSAPATPPQDPSDTEEGGSTHAATPSSTHAATPAAPVLPNVYSGFQTPDPQDDDAPSGRSPGEPRRASTGSKGSSDGGSAAPAKDSPSPSPEDSASSSKRAVRLTADERKTRDAVLQLLPSELREALGDAIPTNVAQVITAALAKGLPRERTPQELVTHRLLPRWQRYWAPRFYAGELTPVVNGKKRKPFGPLLQMLKDTAECGNLWCEDRHDFAVGADCQNCAMRKDDQKAEQERERREAQEDAARQARRGEAQAAAGEADTAAADAGAAAAGPMPTPRKESLVVHSPTANEWWDCENCHRVGKGEPPADGICGFCVKEKALRDQITREQQAVAARYEAPDEEFASAGPAPF